MARFHETGSGKVPFTPEEEAEWDAREAAYAAGAVDRAKQGKLKELKEEAFSRVEAVLPALADEALLELVVELWKSIAPAARNPTADFVTVQNIRTAFVDARVAINALTVEADVLNYNVVTDPSWP
jgi:hypothetical protein